MMTAPRPRPGSRLRPWACFRRRLFAFGLAAAAVFAPGGAGPAAAKDLVVDLTKSVVQVTTGFTGSDVMLYGAKSGPGDVIVVVRGPLERAVVRRKENIAGVWVNTDSVTFDAVPAYYAVASNKPLNDIITDYERAINQIGADQLELEPADIGAPFNEIKFFREALIRTRARGGLYTIDENDLIFLSENMFRTEFRFPATVATGTFSVDVFLVRDGQIENAATKLLNVRKFGFEAFVYDLAHRRPWLYGSLAIIVACLAGWAANAAFRRA